MTDNQTTTKGVYYYLSTDTVDWVGDIVDEIKQKVGIEFSRSDIVQLALDYIRVNWGPEKIVDLKTKMMLHRGIEGLNDDNA